jgi:pilus assembly protein Flp/PilA
MFSSLKKFVRDDSGATAIEYGLIASLIALVVIASVAVVGNSLTNTFTEVSSNPALISSKSPNSTPSRNRRVAALESAPCPASPPDGKVDIIASIKELGDLSPGLRAR